MTLRHKSVSFILAVVRQVAQRDGTTSREIFDALTPEDFGAETKPKNADRVRRVLHAARQYGWIRPVYGNPNRWYIEPAGLARLAHEHEQTPVADVAAALEAMREAGWIEEVEPGVFRINSLAEKTP